MRIPLLLAGLAVFGLGTGCSMIPVAWSAVHSLKGREVAHGSTLYNVNHNTAAAIGAALMSMLLTSLTNRSPGLVAARKADWIRDEAARRGAALDLSKAFAPDVIEHITRCRLS